MWGIFMVKSWGSSIIDRKVHAIIQSYEMEKELTAQAYRGLGLETQKFPILHSSELTSGVFNTYTFLIPRAARALGQTISQGPLSL